MGFWSKLTIVILAVLAGFYIKTSFFDAPHVEKKLAAEEQIVEETPKTVEPQKEVKAQVKKTYATVYFLGMDNQENSLFKTARREVPEGSTKLKYALEQLIQGPTASEKKMGVFSEIPKTTKIRGIVQDEKIIIDLSSDIVNGGGADSVYSRIKQVIKTALANSSKKPIYLYIDGKQADVIGGEGLMLTQPLNENSLDE